MATSQHTLEETWRVRPARFEDVDVILDLWGAMMADHERSDARIRLAPGALAAYRSYLSYHLASGDSQVMVADRRGEVIAYCLVAITRNLPMFLPERYGYLSDLFVGESLRRQGIGRRLVASVTAWLRGQGVASMQLQFYHFNQAGEAFWKAIGFQPYYTRMWLDLD